VWVRFSAIRGMTTTAMIEAGRRLSVDGLIEIARIAETMNRKKPRHELIRILRDYTPETLDTGS